MKVEPTTYELDPEGYRLTMVCGVAGVWEGQTPLDNPSDEIENIARFFSYKSTTTRGTVHA